MAGTIFNIFGDHLANPIHKPALRVNDISKENSGVGKGAFSATPAGKLPGCSTPQVSKVKKTFLQNRGALSVGKLPNKEATKNVQQSSKKNVMQIYEDSVVVEKQAKLAEELLINTEYNRKPYIDDDDYLSDSDVVITDENIDNMIFDMPRNDVCLPEFKTLTMLDRSDDEACDLNDVLYDNNVEYLDLDLDLPEV